MKCVLMSPWHGIGAVSSRTTFRTGTALSQTMMGLHSAAWSQTHRMISWHLTLDMIRDETALRSCSDCWRCECWTSVSADKSLRSTAGILWTSSLQRCGRAGSDSSGNTLGYEWYHRCTPKRFPTPSPGIQRCLKTSRWRGRGRCYTAPSRWRIPLQCLGWYIKHGFCFWCGSDGC